MPSAHNRHGPVPNRFRKSSRRRYRLATGVFNPLTITGLHLWYDFSDITTLFQDAAMTTPVTANGQAILGVTDKSGSGKHLTEATNGPAYTVNIQNGQSVARFDGTNDVLKNASITASATQTLFSVLVKRTAPGATGSSAIVMTGTYPAFTDSDDSATDWVYFRNAALGNVAITGATATSWGILTHAYASAASLEIFYNGTSAVTLDPHDAVTTATLFQLGFDTGVPANVDIGECLLYTGAALSAANRLAVERYLGSKWGITVA
jgi:hypothetical protein